MTSPVLRLGLIGCGTVGRRFVHHLADAGARLEGRTGARVQLVRVAVRHPDRHQFPSEIRVGRDPLALACDPTLDLVVEASGSRHAAAWLLAALDRGAAVVTANKQAVAGSPRLLRALAERHPRLACEAAVAGAVPIVRTLRDSLQGEEIRALRGVLNGTSTHVLSAVEQGVDWREAVAAAVADGLAEPGGSADFDGSDAAAKLAILCTVAWRTPIGVQDVRVRGLDERVTATARDVVRSGARVRLVAEAWLASGATRGPAARHLLVEPRVLAADDPLSRVTGATNAIELQAALAGVLHWSGPGAGGDRTASALLADVAALARELRNAPHEVAA